MGLNRIYKVIWSKTKGCYVVVSEMAKRVGRNKAKAIVMSTAAMSMAVAVAPAVMNVDRVEATVLIGAADGTTISANKSTVSSNGITIGGAITKAGEASVHIGENSGSMGTRNVVIGTNASAGYDENNPAGNPPKDDTFNQSVAIGSGRKAGEGARAYGDQSIAIGSNTIARGNSSIAIGNDDVNKTEEIMTTYTDLEGNRSTATIGTAYNKLTGKNLKWDGGQYADTSAGEAAVAVGVKAEAGDISLALGTAAKAKVVNGVAIGSGATADRDNAVAIGGGATTEKAGTKETEAIINNLKFTWAGGKNTLAGDVVSFGKADYERQLKNVAAGNVSENSTDAINGSQFYGVLQHLTADPVYFYGADDSTAGKIEGVEAAEKSADALKKKVVAKSMADSRLNLRGGADKDKLSENNIGVTYEDTSSIRFRLSKELAGLTSAEFKNTAGDVTTINGDGVTITPVANGKKPVSVTKNGLNNGGNVIANVAGNLEGAKPNSTEPTTNATAPNNASTIKNNAATVGDVLQAGWNLQNNSEERDFVKPYDTVNFEDGNGTTAVVDTDNTTSTVKYNVNLGNGLDKTKDNKITVKPADKSLEVNKNGVKVKTDGTTITTEDSGLTVVTGEIEPVTTGTNLGTVKVTDGDAGKIATVDSVVKAVNNAAFTLKASADGGTLNANSTAKATGELIKAGNTIEMIAGKNLEVKHNKNGKITFATVENPSFETVQIGDDGPKFSATADGNIRVSDKDGTKPVKITNVKDGDISKTSTDAINGSQFHAVAKNTIKLAGQNGTDAATETAGQELDKKDGIKFTVKSSDGKLLDITADANGDTITITPKTGTITTTGGVPTAVTTNGKLVTVDEVVNALKDLGWKATAGTDGTGTMIGTGATEELIKAGNTVTFKAGNNLSIKQDGKNFIYSLNPALTGLTSAEFKDGDNKVKITPTGITITKPAGTTENTVTLNQNGLNNGGNPITNVAGNLQGAKAGTDAPTTSATAPTLGAGADEVNKNNAATVGDILNAGWNLQEKGVAKDFVKPYDTVNFIDGDGTSVAVATANDGTTSTVKYSVNLGNGLEKTTDNKITVTPADKSLEVTTAGLKAKTDNTTITTGDSGLKVVTGGIEAGTTPGTMKVTNGDTGKIATVDSVVDAVNNAAFTLKASAITGGTRNTGSTVTATGESIKAGNTIEMIAGKNLDVTHNTNGKIIFATVENPSFNTVQIGNGEGPKFSATADGNIKVSDKDDTKPVKITNVADGTISDSSKDAINGSQIHKLVNKAIKLAGQNGSEAAGETEPQTLTQQDPIKFTVKSSDGSLLHVEAAGSTITLTPKTGTITTAGGVPTATTTNGKLVTADEVVNALTEMGWKATAGTDGTGTIIGTGAAEELIKAGNTVTFKAGNNLAIKQDSKNFIYSLKTDLTGLTSAEFKDANNNAVKITPNGVSFKKPNATDADTVTLNQNGLNNGGNPITNVAGNLQGAKAGTDAPTTNATAPSLGTGTDQVNKNNAATVGDVLNAGWNLQEKGVAKDFVKPYDTVNFMDGDGTSVAVATATDGTTSTVKYSVNTGDGLEKNKDNKITVKAGDKSLEVSDAGVAVKKADKSLEVTDDGLKVKTDNTTIKTGDTGLTVNTGTINKVTEGNTAGTVVAKTGDENKIATVSNVVEAINNAAWTATSAATSAGELGATATNQLVKAGDKVTFEADKNIKITQDAGKFTFATKDNVTFTTVQVGGDQGPKFSKTDAGDIKVSGSDNTTPVKITNVQDGDISADSKDAINGSQFHAVAKNKIKLAGQNGTSAATETDEQELDKKGGIKFTVKSSNGDLLEVTAAKDTITITPKTATITTGKDGVPTANTDGGKLVTADQLVTALTEMGWKATADKDDTGTVTGNAPELIKAGETVTFKAGDNLSIKQEGKNFTYSLNPALTGLTSAEFKEGDNKVKITPTGITITKPADPTAGTPENTVTLNQNGLNNGGNTISNVKSNLPDTKNSDTTTGPNTATKSHAAPTLGTSANEVNPANAATVGDVLNAGWNLQGNGTEVDFVKPYDTVNFVNGVNTTAVVSTVDGKTSNVTYNVTGLPITYTDKDGNLVSKIGDNFYKVNDQGQPLDAKGNPSTKVNKDGKPVDDAGKVIDPINTTNNPVKTSLVNPAPETNKTGTTSPTTLDNVTSKLENYKADPVNGKDPAKNSLRDLTNTNVTNDTVATVGDIRNMGWIVSSDKTTGANGAVTADEYSEAVKNANEVRFVGEGSAIVSGKTAGNVRTITVKVDNQTGTNKTVTPVNYTKADGTKVYPQEVDNGNGTKTVKFFENPDGTGKEIPSTEVITSVNGPKGTTTPATLSNVKSNLPDTKNSDTTNTATDPSNATTSKAAPNTTNKTGDSYINPNNAATVSDVLNAGWNLQGNGTDVDFVKPYDKVNFVNGLNTTAVVSTVDGVTSNVTFNVTGLPITYTDKDGKPVSKIGDNFYTVNDKGQPLDSKGNPSTKVNNEGKPVDDAGNVITPIDTTNNPVKTSLVNPAPGANKTGTTSPTTLDNVTSKLENYNGAPVNGKNPVKNDLRDLSNQNITDNTVATVGDIRNMGWIVSSNKTTGENGAVTADEYSATVKNANEVKFVGEGTAIVSGKTVGDVRTITVKVDDQTSTNNAVTPVVYTDKDGKQVYPTGETDNDGNKIFNTKPDGKGDTVKGPVKTTVNGPKGTTSPTSLSNVKNNIPNVNDGSKTITDTDGNETAGDVTNINKAPLTAEEAAALANPKTKEGQTNPKYIGNNAATVSDVLNAGWNLQGNGAAKDFVKPFDTVNFINGLNTTAVVTTSDDGTTSNVTYNVTGLPVTYTTTDGTPVTKIGDKYYKVNDQGQPVDGTGAPVTKFNKDGKPLDKDGHEVPDVNITDTPLKTSLVNPAPETNKTGTTSPTSLSNVKNNIPTVNDEDKTAHKVDGTAIDGKNNTEAPITAGEAANLLKPIVNGAANPNFVGNNAATVSDVLNAGWNLQNNGTAKDFVKPYDTVNFVNGGNTTAVVTTHAEGTASDVTFNVTGLPITNTITDNGKEVPVVKVGNTFYPAKPDGTPDIQKGQDGNPTNGYVQANDGKVYPRDAVTITKNQDGTTTVTPNTDATPKTVNTNLVNPNVANTTDKPGNNVNTPNQLGNVANGAKTFDSVAADGTMANDAKPAVKLANDGKWYPADKVEANGKPKDGATPVANPLAPKNAAGDVLEKGNDGKWYKANELTNGIPNPTATAQTPEARPANSEKSGLINFTESNPNNAATIGDLQNMGWVVSAEGNSYSDQVRNANEVKFVGEGTAIVTGKTDDKGIRTITVKVDDQTSTNNAVTPVVYTDKDGKQVYPTGKVGPDGNQIFNTKPDGKGEEVTGPVKTTINGPKGTTTPTSLNNVKNNIPNVNDGSKTITDTDGNETAGDVTNINKAPLTAEEAAALANPKTKEGQTNPKYIGNNAATVSDVLNAGWNLQGNGAAKDFVKPYDTVNFVNGLNTTAVVTTSDDGTTSNVTYNVTGLPVTYTTTDGTPVTKIGDKYYKVNDKGQPVDGTGAPVTKFNKDGKPLDANGHEVPDVDITNNPLTTSVVNAKPAADKTSTTSPTTLSNVKSNLPDTKNNDATTGPSNATTAQVAPNTTNKTGNNYVNPNNAATVSDVLNAGWNLQGNGTDVDFVKPYDKVNFVNGLNTTAVVSTVDGVTSNVTFNVTGLPITYTDKDGKPVSKIGDNFYTVNDKGQPLDSKGNPSTKVNNEGKPVDDAGNVITPIDTTNNPVKTSLVNPAPGANKTGTTSPTTLDNVTSKLENYKDAPVNGKDPVRNSLVNLSKPENGQPNVSDNTVATVGDLRNMGWIVSSNKTTGENGAVTADEYSATVKNANEVKFVGEGTAIVSGKTVGDVRTITVKVDDQTSTNNAVTPVVYTDKDGKQVYPTGETDNDGNKIFNTKPDGKGDTVKGPVKTTVNGPKGTTSPTTLSNVEGNLEGAKTGTNAPTTSATAPTLGTEANQVNKNNAATVGDVLQAGWNLQNNGTAKDFVKPYDTVNFVNGGNTTAVVTTNAEGTVSDVTFNVTGLPVTYTTEDGAPVSKVGDKYYKVNDKGQPISEAGKPAVGKNNDGKLVDENNNVIEPIDTTKPLKTALVNPTPAGDKPNTTTATQLGNVTSGLDKYGDQVNNADVPGTTDKNRGLVDLSKPTNGDAPKVSDNTAATVGDLRNMGWIVSSNKTTGENGAVTADEYSATVKNANEVKFVGEGTAIVSGKTEGDVRTITVKVDDQTSTNNAVTPVVYTDKDGKQVYPTGKVGPDGNQIFNTKPDGKGEEVTGPVKTTINGPKGTTSPTTLSNVEGNLEGAKTGTNAPTTSATAPTLGTGTDQVNKNNAATVGDVLQAGWNLQNNGAAKDFVKPYDTVNFVNGLNTTAVVTTSDDGKTSNITYNVTGLPVTYATADGTPVSKIGDKYYKVNDKGQPVDGQGNPSTKVNNNGEPIDGNGNVITPIDTTANPLKTSLVNPTPETNKTGTTSPTTLDNVTSKLENYKDAPVNGKDPVRNSLVNLSKPENGQPNVSDNTVATVGDLRNMGWIVSSNKTTGENGAVTADEYSATVKNANEVKFVGEGTAIVSGKTEGDVRTITVKVDDQTSTNNAVTPVVYTDKDGKQVYPTGKTDNNGNQIFNTKPDGKGEDVTGPVKTTINGPKGTNSPTSLNNVKNNIPNVNDGSKTITDTDGNETAGDVTNINKAPLTAEEAAALANPKTKEGQTNPKYIGNNAATVSDVLNAGWNLQNNGTAKDFVKPYDTVNFRNGGNTTVTVTTDDNLTSHVQVNVTGLPVSNTITDPTTGKQVPVVKVGDAFYRTNPDGTPDIARNDKGEPTNGYVRANDGKLYPRENVTVTPPTDANGTPTITPNTGATPTTVNTNLVNPNVDNTTNEPGNNVSTPNQLGNVANGANTFNAVDADGKDYVKANNGKYYEPSKVNADGSLKEGTNATADAKNPLVLANDGKWYPADKVSDKGTPEAGATAVENPLAPKNAAGEPLVQAKDGKWYKPSDLQPNGTPTPTAKPQDNAINNKAGLVDFSNSNPNNVATIGDLQNMGWVVSAQGNSYSNQVRNTNEVKFVGEGTASVTGKTDDKGVRTITVKVDDQVSTNNSVTPVVYTDKDGKTVYPIKDDKGNVTYHTTPDGKGENDKVIPNGDVNTSINGPKDDQGNTRPASLSNVKNNIPAVNDENKTITDADGKVKPDAGNVENINKAPLTAEEAADLLKPMKDGKANPNFVGNNAATVSDVLNAGWNLQNNGTAKDFVKPYDTVNFVSGLNTTAVVTTSDDGTTSHVTYNVTGLPVTYTTADGTPVSKIGDKFYKVNDKGQPIDEQGNPSTKVNDNGEPIDGNGNVINAIDTAANPLKTSLVNPAPEANKTGTTSPTTLDNVTSKLANYSDPDVNGKAPVRNNLVDLSKPENGQPNVSDNTVATVGDLRNMGWIVSSNKATDDLTKDYSDTVKNANEVKFVGEGTAIVSGKTDDKGVRTITVKVDDQTSTNNSVTPIVYTKADGTQVYPTNKKDDQGHPIFNTKADGSGDEVPGNDVVTSVNGPNGTKGDKAPTTLKNVKNNIPNVNDGSKTITNPDGTEKAGDVENINKAPLTAEDAAKLSNPKTADGAANPKYIGNNAATVSDVLNAGWNLQNNGTAKDFVKPYDTVNFINGLGTTAVVTTREGNTTSDVTFNVKAANGSVTVDEDGVKVTTGEMKPEVGADNKETGAIATPVDPTTAKQLKDTLDAAVKELATAKDALKTAETALAAKPNDPALQKDVEDKKAQVAEKQTPVNKAQKAHDDAGLNKVATVQNVAEAINNSGFNLKTSADGGEKLTTGSKNDGELIKPGNTVEMVAGNNLTVKQDEHGKITYATKDDVTFKTVDTGTLNVGSPTTYTDGKGNTYTKVGENYYKPADVENGVPKQGATPVDVTTPVTPVSPVTMKAEAAKPATNNVTDAQPSSALNITSKDGKPTQITGVGSTLNTKTVDTTPTGTEPGTTPNTTPTNLVDLEGTKDAPVNKNAAATVGDLQNMGWVVSAKDGNGYKDVVKNANVVDFKGDQGVTVTGKTLADGTREITVGIKEGEVTNKVTITHGDGSKTDAVKIGDNYYKVDKDGKPIGFDKDENGKPAGTPLKVDPNTDKVTNAGAGVVTGNAVANAIQDSGWNVGIGSTDKDFSKDAKVYDKVNPNDDVKFANGANTNVSMVTVDALNEDGTKKATTYVKVDINRDLKIDSVTTGGTATDKNGNNLVKVGDQYYKEGDVTIVTNPDGTTTVTPKENAKAVPPADVVPAKDGAMIVKNADGKDVVSATVGKDGNGAFGINGKDGKNGISMTAKDGQGTIGVNGKDGKSTTIAGDTITIKDKDNNATNIGVNTITLVDKAGNTTTTTADKSEIKDAAGNINANTATGNTLKDPNGNTHTSTASTSELKDKDGNTNTSTPTTNVLKDTNGNTNTSAATGTTYKDKDENKTVVGPKEINISDKSGENTASLTNKDLLLNAKDPNTGVDKTSHVSGDKIAFTTTDEMEKVVDKDGKPVIDPATGKQKEVVKMEKVFDKDGKPVIDPATGKQKEVVKNPGNSTEYTNEGLKVIPNSTVARDVNGNPTFLDKDGKPVMKDTDGKYKYVGQDGKPGDKYDGSVGVLKPNVVDNTRVISFGMDKPVLDKNGKPVTGPDGNPVMTEGISAGMQQIHNVAPGTKDTDGVNVSQLRGTTININNRMNRMGAQAAALAGLQSIQYDPLEPTQISAGLGHYKGSSALALGVNHFKNESTMFHMGASYNGHGDETMMNASVTWKFGARADETAVKDTFRQGPISSAYTLQDKVSALEAQNKIQKDQLEELKALNEKQQEQIAELFKRLIEKA